MLKKVLVVSLALNAAFVVLFAVAYGRHVVDVPEASSKALARNMQPMHVNPSWIKSGNPRFMVAESAVVKGAKVSTGLWSCDGPTTFDWVYGVDETVHVLEGEVEISYLGEVLKLATGDTAHFLAGTTATWTVPKRVMKSFTLHDPGPLARWYRRMVDAINP